MLKKVKGRPVVLPKERKLEVCWGAGVGAGVVGEIGSDEDTTCVCGRTGRTDRFMLDCDRCHKWFHGFCVQIRKVSEPCDRKCE